MHDFAGVTEPSRNLLVLSKEFRPQIGGIAEWVYHVVLALCRAQWNVTVVTVDTYAAATAMDASEPFTTMRIIPEQDDRLWTKALCALRHVKFARDLRNLFERRSFRYVLAAEREIFRGYNGLLRSLALSRHRVRTGVMFHGTDVEEVPQLAWARRRILDHIVRNVDDVFCNSHYVAQAARAAFPGCSDPVYVGCGLSPETLPTPIRQDSARKALGIDSQNVILTVARLVPKKGVDMVIQSLPKVLSRFPSTVYLVAGAGEDLERVRQLAEHNGCAKHVRFAGELDNRVAAHYYYCAADLFVMPARQEGFGIVYLEAAHYGLPTVGGRVGGVSDAIADGGTGILVNPEDPSEIAGALIKLLGDPQLRARLGADGQRRVHNEFTWDAVASRIMAKANLNGTGCSTPCPGS
jgi:phosphatidylinositol alpha-1,6-mannosyltransferase